MKTSKRHFTFALAAAAAATLFTAHAQTALDDGAETLGILALQDAYGTSLSDVAEKTFKDGGGSVVFKTIYDPKASEYSAEVGQLKKADPDAIALIGFAESTKIVDEMVKQGLLPLKSSNKTLYLVDGNLKQWGDDVSVSLEGAKGTTPGPVLESDFQGALNDAWTAAGNSALDDYSYAAESYDAVILLALTSLASGSTDAADIATKLQEVSGGSGEGTKCTSFAECADIILEGGVADYDGVSGPITFDENGDPTEASIGIFQYKADNTHERIDTR